MNSVNPIQAIFPKYSAAVKQIGVHGQDAYVHGRGVVDGGSNAERLDAALRAGNSFDHAVTASRDIPVGRFFTPVEKYYAGYEAAKAAASMIIESGAIPGARERVGRQELIAAREEFNTGLATYASVGDTRYGRFRSTDFLRSSLADAGSGLSLLKRNELAQPLLGGLTQIRTAVHKHAEVPADTVKLVNDLFGQATADFDARIAKAQEAFEKSGQEPAPLVNVPKHILRDMQP